MLKAILLIQSITCSSSHRVVIKNPVLRQSTSKIYSIGPKRFSSANNNYEESSPILQVSNHAQDTEEIISNTRKIHMMAIEDLEDRTNKSKCDLELPEHTGTEKNSSTSSIDDIHGATLTSDQNEKSIESKQNENQFENVPLTCIEFIRETFMEESQSLDSLEKGEILQCGKYDHKKTISGSKVMRFYDRNEKVCLGVILGMSFLIYVIIVINISF